jgi:septum formation protein
VPSSFILASASPRRRELLSAIGYDFEVVPADLDEDSLTYGRDAIAIARRIARAKALHVAASRPDEAVLAADTVVSLRGVFLGKPVDADDARRMLNALSARTHRVVTGVVVVPAGRKSPIVSHAMTLVTFKRLRADEIETWIATGRPFDKAGAYGVQDDPAFRPVARYEGCYCNGIGLPLGVASRLLDSAGIRPEAAAGLAQCDGCPIAPDLQRITL